MWTSSGLRDDKLKKSLILFSNLSSPLNCRQLRVHKDY